MNVTLPYLSETEAPTRADIETLSGWTLLEFGTDWCAHCRAAQGPLQEAAASLAGWHHIKVEDGPARPLGRAFRIKLWPTLIWLRDGQEVGRLIRPTRSREILDAAQAARHGA